MDGIGVMFSMRKILHYLVLVNDELCDLERDSSDSRVKKYMQAYHDWVMYLISKCRGVEQVIHSNMQRWSRGSGWRCRQSSTSTNAYSFFTSPDNPSLVTWKWFQLIAGVKVDIGGPLCVLFWVFVFFRQFAKSGFFKGSNVLRSDSNSCWLSTKHFGSERYCDCNESKEDLTMACVYLERSPEGGASRDCNSSFNLSASNSIESSLPKRSRDTTWFIQNTICFGHS